MSVIIPFLIFCFPLQAAKATDARQFAEKLAIQRAQELGFTTDSMDRFTSLTVLTWDTLRFVYPYFPEYSPTELKKLKRKVGAKIFWVAYFRPKHVEDIVYFDMDLWVFVDSSGKKVLMTIGGK